jgi:hypothetical protein
MYSLDPPPRNQRRNGAVKQLIELFKSKPGTLPLFHLELLLCSWPLMSITTDRDGVGFFRYLLVVIAALDLNALHNDVSGEEEY